MTPERRQRAPQAGFGLTLTIALTALLGSPAKLGATPIDYTLSPAIIVGSDTITGTFTFDPATTILSAANISVTGTFQTGEYNEVVLSGTSAIWVATDGRNRVF